MGSIHVYPLRSHKSLQVNFDLLIKDESTRHVDDVLSIVWCTLDKEVVIQLRNLINDSILTLFSNAPTNDVVKTASLEPKFVLLFIAKSLSCECCFRSFCTFLNSIQIFLPSSTLPVSRQASA